MCTDTKRKKAGQILTSAHLGQIYNVLYLSHRKLWSQFQSDVTIRYILLYINKSITLQNLFNNAVRNLLSVDNKIYFTVSERKLRNQTCLRVKLSKFKRTVKKKVNVHIILSRNKSTLPHPPKKTKLSNYIWWGEGDMFNGP